MDVGFQNKEYECKNIKKNKNGPPKKKNRELWGAKAYWIENNGKKSIKKKLKTAFGLWWRVSSFAIIPYILYTF